MLRGGRVGQKGDLLGAFMAVGGKGHDAEGVGKRFPETLDEPHGGQL